MTDALQTFLILGRKEKKNHQFDALVGCACSRTAGGRSGKEKKDKRETHTRQHDARMRVTEGEAEEKDRRMES